jgi:hypothetical protein
VSETPYLLAKRVVTRALAQKPAPGRVRMTGTDTPLKRLRVAAGITGRAAAGRMGIGYRQYYRIENGRSPVPRYFYVLIAAGAMAREYSVEEGERILCTNQSS